jgi:flagellar basal-body rod protein FlgB
MDVLATNLANADTPHYKARDTEFAATLAGLTGPAGLTRTHRDHMATTGAGAAGPLKYRVPHQPALDGNTVESDLELARFAENAVAYQASLSFVNGKIATLRAAISGGR